MGENHSITYGFVDTLATKYMLTYRGTSFKGLVRSLIRPVTNEFRSGLVTCFAQALELRKHRITILPKNKESTANTYKGIIFLRVYNGPLAPILSHSSKSKQTNSTLPAHQIPVHSPCLPKYL